MVLAPGMFSLRHLFVYHYNKNGSRIYNLARNFITLESHRMPLVRIPFKISSAVCVYSSDSKKNFINLDKKTEVLKDVLEHKKEQLKVTEHKIRLKGERIVRDIKHQKDITGQKIRERKEHIIKDIRETKAKVKEKIEEIVEVSIKVENLEAEETAADMILQWRENIFTVPNFLCVARIVMSPYLGHLIVQDNYNVALGLLVCAGVTDLLDGWIARTWKSQSSKMGSFLDPMADKVLVGTLFVTLTWQDLIPLYLTLLIVARDVVLMSAGFVIRYRSLPPPITLSRYFDLTHATAQLAPTFISKVNTAMQLILVGTTVASPVFGFVDHPVLHTMQAVTVATTALSALSYLVRKDTYKYLRNKS